MKISSVSVGTHLVRGPLQVVAGQPVVPENHAAGPAGQLGTVFKGISAGAVSHQAWAGFQASHTTSLDDVAALLVKNGLAPEHAPGVARKAMDIIQAEPTKMLLIAVSAGGGFWAAVEAGRTLFGLRLSRLWQLGLTLLVALAAALVFHVLKTHGVAA